MEPKKILIIDDDAIIRKALSEVFELKGFEVFTAENGAAGLETFRKEKPHLIILDLVMPVMGGVECLEKIRTEDSEVQVIILTGYGTDDQLNRVQELGASDVIRKGMGFEDFLASIEDTIERRESGSLLARDPSDVKILVADDDAIIRTLLIEFLLGKGFLVLSAKDGEETTEVILKHRPTIVFLDLIMPKKDGKTVIKEMPREISNQTKWVFITGHGYKTKELREINIPYRLLEKPFSLQTFESTVVELLQSFSVKI